MSNESAKRSAERSPRVYVTKPPSSTLAIKDAANSFVRNSSDENVEQAFLGPQRYDMYDV